MDGTIITILVLAIYITVLSVLQYKGILEKHGMSLWGPFLMIRTHKGENIIERLSKFRFWRFAGAAAIVVCVIVGFLLIPVLIWNAVLSMQIPVSSTPSPALILGIPGINPLMRGYNFWYAIIGLIVAVVVHEGAHGIMTRFAGIKLKSVGLLFLVVPLGAFVEPDEEELGKTSSFKRTRVFAAGPFTNIVIAIIFGMVFSSLLMGSVQIKTEGAGILGVIPDFPADLAGLKPGMIITEVDGERIMTSGDLHNFLSRKKPGDYIFITTYENGAYRVQLTSLATYTKNQSDSGKAFLGVGGTIGTADAREIYTKLQNPLSSPENLFLYTMLPIFEFRYGLSFFSPPYTDFFSTPPFFWIISGCIYWIFWINLMLAATNTLPAIPLDGGHIFRELVDRIISRFGLKEEKRIRLAGMTSIAMSLFVLGLIIMQFIGPSIGALLRS